MKKLLKGVLVLTLGVLLSACGNNGVETKGKCDVFECMKVLSVNDTIEQMNKTVGFDAEISSETELSTTYEWKLSEDTSVTASIPKSGNSATIKSEYPTKAVKKRADFSKWNEIETKLRSRESLLYDEFVKLVGGVEGILSSKSETSLTYKWYNKDGGYLFAYFDPKTKVCTSASGRF